MSEQPQPRAGALITSLGNERVRFVKSLYKTAIRRKEKLFVVEGVRLVEEALAASVRPELALVAPDQLAATPRGAALLERLAAFPILRVSESVLRSLSDTVTPQGVIAVLPLPVPPPRPTLGAVALILDRVRDPGNAGTLLRSADASGVTRTVAFVDSVDAFAPKVVRAAMGAHFRLTILEDAHWPALLPRLGPRPRYLAVSAGGLIYDQVNWTKESALIIGGEAEGAGSEAEALATERITIPMRGPAESLNAAMAGTIILFQAASQRRENRLTYDIAPGEPRLLPADPPHLAPRPAPKPSAAPGPKAIFRPRPPRTEPDRSKRPGGAPGPAANRPRGKGKPTDPPRRPKP